MKKSTIKELALLPVFALCLASPSIAMMAGSDVAAVSTKTIHHIFVSGNTYSSVADILGSFPALKEGATVDVNAISDEILLGNESGFRQFAVDLRPVDNNSADVYLTVKEANPARWVLSADNTGDSYTGKFRTGVTYINGNVTGQGDTMMLSYTTSPSQLSDVKQFGLYYNVLLPKAKDNMYFTASYSDTNSGQIISGDLFSMNASGKGTTVGLHYVHNLLRTPESKESLDFGLDSREYKNTTLLNIADTPVNIGVNINALPASLAYQKTDKTATSVVNYGLTYVHNIPDGALDSNAQYDLYRSGTKATYQLWRGNANYQHMLSSGWLTNVIISGQYTAERLIYPEQFGLGGAHSIRGLNERDVAGDRGVQVNFELYTPEIAKGQHLLAFFDIGKFYNIDPQPGELITDSASSVGLGWRYADSNGYSLSLDWGYVLNGTVNTPAHSSKYHLLATKTF